MNKEYREKSPERVTFDGICCFHSETGTEGGYWAFQDNNFIEPNTRYFSCTECNLWWDKQKTPTPALPDVLLNPPRKFCGAGDHHFEPISKTTWSYEGMHILKDGDRLTIYSPEDSKIKVWSGVISLQYYPVFRENAFGLWIHADQRGIDRETWAKWFFEEYPAKLVTKKREEAESE